jgi:hypothetical protein
MMTLPIPWPHVFHKRPPCLAEQERKYISRPGETEFDCETIDATVWTVSHLRAILNPAIPSSLAEACGSTVAVGYSRSIPNVGVISQSLIGDGNHDCPRDLGVHFAAPAASGGERFARHFSESLQLLSFVEERSILHPMGPPLLTV